MFKVLKSPASDKNKLIFKDGARFPFGYINEEGVIFFMEARVPFTVNELKELVVDIQMATVEELKPKKATHDKMGDV